MITTKEKIEDELLDIESNIEDAIRSIHKLQRHMNNLDDIVFDLNQKTLKEVAKYGLQTMIEKYGYSSNEVRDVEHFIGRE